MIVVTGAAGFIGSVLIGRLNAEGITEVVAVDKFGDPEKEKNLAGKSITERVERDAFFAWLDKNWEEVQFIYHIGARTDTTEFDTEIFDRLNLHYTQQMWKACTKYDIPLVYASSAATYGLGELGYSDNESLIPRLKPLNPYGDSKNDFDVWALQQEEEPPFWVGLKFFNVYGPNEYHKGRMASVIFHAHRQIGETGQMNLFRSHNPDYKDGGQMRDFIYVKDLVDVCLFLMNGTAHDSGIYNLGTGKARTFLDLANGTFVAMGKEPKICFIDTPADIREKYQYFTEAEMGKLRGIGYDAPFHTLEEGIADYVKEYLSEGNYY